MEIFNFKYGDNLRTKNNKYKPIQYTLGGKGGDCWECVSHMLSEYGYPKMNYKGKVWRISRWSYTHYYNKEIEKGMHILHNCDNPKCINPLHLREGTDQDNANDRVERNRQAHVKGEEHGNSFLTEGQVIEILKSDKSRKELSNIYNIHIDTVASIKTGRLWGYLNPEIKRDVVKKRLNKEDVVYIRKNKDINVKQLAEMFNVDSSNIRKILNYETWKEVVV